MGLLKNIFGKNEKTSQEERNNNSQIMMSNLCVCEQNLDKVLVNLSKSNKVNLLKHIAKVVLVMDYSGSMEELYLNGSVQRVITRLLPIALKFDDDKKLESWLFSNREEQLISVSINNYQDYVKKVMLKSKMSMGGTNYAPVLNAIINSLDKNNSIPTFVIFITDGENFDKKETNNVVKELSEYNIFVQFIGIGNESFHYLRSLDDMPDRKYDNTGFTAVSDMNKMNDEELYTELIRQYKDWLNSK